jgi:hypothetical protein
MTLGPLLAAPGHENNYQAAFIGRVIDSFARATGKSLIHQAGIDSEAPGRSAWLGNFALLTHRGDARATLNYGNAFALSLWEYDWNTFVSTPSAATAPDEASELRDVVMKKVGHDNFVAGYSGARISRTGRRFLIQDVTIWRLMDEAGGSFGVGAFFRHYRYL